MYSKSEIVKWTGSSLTALFNYFFDLCLLRAKPQDLHASNVLLVLTLMVNLLLAACTLGEIYGGASRALLAGLVDNLFLLAVLWLLLFWKGVAPRLIQTASAIFGVSILLGLILIPIRALGGPQTADPQSVSLLVGLGSLLVLVWFLVVMGHILRHALDMPMGRGIMIAIIIFVASNQLMEVVVPLP